MNLTSQKSRIKTLRPGDPDFNLRDKFVVTNRAGLEITKDCPEEYKHMITTCILKGWVVPVASMYDYEYTMDKLKETE